MANRFRASLDEAAGVGYVESWDATEFPEFTRREPAFLVENVEFTIDGEVLRGHLRVAKAIVEAWVAENPRLVLLEIAEWISDNKAADDEDRNWQRRWQDRLDETPAILEALRGRDEGRAERLFDRAKLTVPQRLAMRLFLRGRPGRESAAELQIGESAYRERVEQALDAIRGLSLGAAG